MPATPEQRTLLNLMLMMSAADSNLREVELSAIGDLIRTLPVFSGVDTEDLARASQDLATLLDVEDGIDRAVADVQALPAPLHETAYALAVEIAVADSRTSQEELRLLEVLREEIGVDPLMRAAIEASARVRHRRL